MSNQDRYIPGVPCWVDTTQPDPEAAVAFYGELFGWQFEDVMPPESPARYFVARLGGGDVAAVSSQMEGAPTAWNTYVWVENADETAAKVRAAGGNVLSEPMDVGEAAGWPCAPIPRAPRSASGSRTATAARRSSTSRAR